MKTKFLIGIAAFATIGFTACDKSAKLAGDVEGTWTAPKINKITGCSTVAVLRLFY